MGGRGLRVRIWGGLGGRREGGRGEEGGERFRRAWGCVFVAFRVRLCFIGERYTNKDGGI